MVIKQVFCYIHQWCREGKVCDYKKYIILQMINKTCTRQYSYLVFCGKKICEWKPSSKQYFTTKTKVWILSCACFVNHLYNYYFLGLTDFTLPTPLMNITGNLFNHHALQNHSGYAYGEHQHININKPEDIPIGLGALMGVYLVFTCFILFATKIIINNDN